MESENPKYDKSILAEQWRLDPPKPPKSEEMSEREAKIYRVNRQKRARELGRRVPTYLKMARTLSGDPNYNEIPDSLIPTPPNYEDKKPGDKNKPTVAEILSDNPDIDDDTRRKLNTGVGRITVSAILDLQSDVTKTTDQTPEGQFHLPAMDLSDTPEL